MDYITFLLGVLGGMVLMFCIFLVFGYRTLRKQMEADRTVPLTKKGE